MSNHTDCTKKKYLDEATAQLALKNMLASKKCKNRWKVKRVYQCEFCQFWHLTTRKEAEINIYTLNEFMTMAGLDIELSSCEDFSRGNFWATFRQEVKLYSKKTGEEIAYPGGVGKTVYEAINALIQSTWGNKIEVISSVGKSKKYKNFRIGII